MASLFGPLPNLVRLLDAGAGAGALTSAFVSRICDGKDRVREIHATLYESDPLIQAELFATMRECENACAAAGIEFTFSVHPTDFIEETTTRIANELFGYSMPAFDVAIVNPPYRKIHTDSPARRWLRTAGIETSNLYTGFIALIHRLLGPGGQLVAITPRSFCNGPYFRPFREEFLNQMELRRLHVFDSRQAAFRGDGVLQENIIFHAVKGRKQPDDVMISSSSGEHGGAICQRTFPFAQIVHPRDTEKFIHIPSAEGHAAAKETMDGLHSTLDSLGVTVSTGRVVEYRLRDDLRAKAEAGTVPLIYPCHFNAGTIHWPDLKTKKPNAIVDTESTRKWLIPSGVYVLTKRFTSKEERRRVVASLFDPREVNSEWIGFENHLNYFHADGKGLDRKLALGLLAFLSSTLVDQYFRRFSGQTQVNASDLRKLSYPAHQTLLAMGSELERPSPAQNEIDELVARHLHAPQ